MAVTKGTFLFCLNLMIQALTFKDSCRKAGDYTLSSGIVIIGGEILSFFFLPTHNLLKSIVKNGNFCCSPCLF